MAYKALTKKGEEFILNRCLASSAYGNNRFSGSRPFPLPKSNGTANTTYTSYPKNDLNQPITTAEDLAKNLIYWFNFYSREYQLDANIIAAQAYAESQYNLWIYSNGGAMGLAQFLDTAVYDTIIKNRYTFEQEVDDIVSGITGDYKDIRYIIPNYNTGDRRIVSTKETIQIAKNNREILFQNIINNPAIMIKAQCYLMNFIGGRNNNLAASTLFAYNRGAYLQSKSYDDMIDNATKKFGKQYIQEGLKYVDRIFKLLAGKESLVPVGFGYDIDFTEEDLRNFNINETVLISGEFPLNQAQENKIQTLHPVAQGLFRKFIYTIENETPFKVEITSSYRSFGDQAAVKKKNEAFTPPRPAANPGASYHNYGLALDFILQNPNVPNVSYGFNKTKNEWINTGVPDIGIRLNLRWGGNFSTYDPVHFDLGTKYSISSLQTIARNTYGTDPNDVQGNQIPLTA